LQSHRHSEAANAGRREFPARKFVQEAKVDEQSFRILFVDAAEILISLRPEHYQGPEAVDFQGRGHQWAVL